MSEVKSISSLLFLLFYLLNIFLSPIVPVLVLLFVHVHVLVLAA